MNRQVSERSCNCYAIAFTDSKILISSVISLVRDWIMGNSEIQFLKGKATRLVFAIFNFDKQKCDENMIIF